MSTSMPSATEPVSATDLEIKARLKALDSRAAALLGWTARDPAEALTHFHRALQLDAENESALQGLAWALRRSAQAAPTLSESVDEVGVAEVVQPVEDSAPVEAPTLVETGTALIYAEDIDDDVDSEPTATPVTRPSRIGTGPLPPLPSEPPPSTARAQLSAEPTRRRARWWAHASDIRNPNFWIPTGYLLAITLAEALTVTLFPQGGLILHGLLFVALLVHTALMPRAPQQRAMLATAFAPLIRLLSLSMPLVNVPQLYWYFIVGAPLFAAAFLTARAMRYTPAKIGLTLGHLPTQLTIGLSGIFLGYVEYAILQPQPLIGGTGWEWETIALAAVILFVFTGLLEEVVFRGVMQRAMSEGVGRYGLVYVAVLFAVLHLGYHSALDFLFVLAVALYFGVVVARTGSILGVTLAHGLTNTSMFLFFPFVRPAFDSPSPEALISAVLVAVSAGLALLLGPLLLRRPARAISR